MEGNVENRLKNQTSNRGALHKSKHEVNSRLFGLLFCGMLLTYAAIASCSIHAPFFPLDDMEEFGLVRASGSLSSLLGTDLYHFFRPVKNLLFVLYNWLYFHGGIVAVRLAPLVIGLTSGCAVFGLCCRLFGNRVWALAATAIWMLSPTLVDSNAWLSASNILLMTGLSAAALTCHDLACESKILAGGKPNLKGEMWSLGALLCATLALFAYEGAVSVVALFFAMDWYLHPSRLRRFSTWQLYFLYGLALATYLILRHEVQSTQHILGGFSKVSPPEAMISSGYFTLLHAGIWFWPFNRMAVIGGYYWGQVSLIELAACLLIVIAAIVFSILQRRRRPCLGLGIVWFLLAFAPMSNMLGFRNGPYCDSYIALASVGIAIAFVALLRALWPLRMPAIARAMALATITFMIGSRVAAVFEAAAWSYTWNNPITVYERTLRTFPEAFDAMTELAKLYVARGEYGRADELATKSMELAPDRSNTYAIKAVVAERAGKIQDALKWLEIYRQQNQQKLQFDPWGLTFEADIYANYLNQPQRAEQLYQEAIAHRPWSQDAFRAAYELAYMQAQQGHRKEAIALWEELLVYQPEDIDLHWNLAIAYGQQGDEKRASYHRSFVQKPGRQPSSPSVNDRNFR